MRGFPCRNPLSANRLAFMQNIPNTTFYLLMPFIQRRWGVSELPKLPSRRPGGETPPLRQEDRDQGLGVRGQYKAQVPGENSGFTVASRFFAALRMTFLARSRCGNGF